MTNARHDMGIQSQSDYRNNGDEDYIPRHRSDKGTGARVYSVRCVKAYSAALGEVLYARFMDRRVEQETLDYLNVM